MITYFKTFSDTINSMNFRRHYGDRTFENTLNTFLKANPFARVLEVGGNTRPATSKHAHPNITLTGVDPASEINTESADIKRQYDTFEKSTLCNHTPRDKYDLVVMKMVFEHIGDNHRTLHSISEMLTSNGCFLTKHPSNLHPFSLLNRLLPHELKKATLRKLRPWSSVGTLTGWKSYYHLCNYQTLIREAQRHGLKHLDHQCSYNAADYFAFFPPAFLMVVAYEETLRAINLEALCSDYWILLQKSPQ